MWGLFNNIKLLIIEQHLLVLFCKDIVAYLEIDIPKYPNIT